jgi:hypothetical protein
VRDAQRGPVPPLDWSERYPELEDLFATHLVEGWSSIHESAADAISEGVRYRSIEQLHTALREVRDLLALGLTEEKLDDVLFYALGSYYQPVEQTNAQWLEEVAAQLDEAVKARTDERGSAGSDAGEP